MTTSYGRAIECLAEQRSLQHMDSFRLHRCLRQKGFLGEKEKLTRDQVQDTLRAALALRREREQGTKCPVCGCHYSWHFGPVGSRCGDLSNGQIEPCHGRLVAESEELRDVENVGYVEGESMIRGDVRLHKEGAQFAVSTNTDNERDFLDGAASALAGLDCDASELSKWLPLIVDVACKMRGYKADVIEKRVIIAGAWLPNDHVSIVGTAKIESEQVTT